MTSIYDILDQHHPLCMTTQEDRVALARALRIGLVHELRKEGDGDDYGMLAAIEHINGMHDGPDHMLVTHLNEINLEDKNAR